MAKFDYQKAREDGYTDEQIKQFVEANNLELVNTKTTQQKIGDVMASDASQPVGALIGGGVGLLGGPAAPITVPLGAFAGSMVGSAVKRGGELLGGKAEQVNPVDYTMTEAGKGALAASLAELAYQAPNIIKSIPKGLSKLNPRRYFGEKQAKLAQDASNVQINTNKLMEAGEKYVKNDPAAQKMLTTVSPAIEDSTNPESLLNKMQVWKSAYSSASKVGKSSKAGLYNALYKEGLQQLQQNAPDVYKARRGLALTYEIPKKASQAAWEAIKLSSLGRLVGL